MTIKKKGRKRHYKKVKEQTSSSNNSENNENTKINNHNNKHSDFNNLTIQQKSILTEQRQFMYMRIKDSIKKAAIDEITDLKKYSQFEVPDLKIEFDDDNSMEIDQDLELLGIH